MQETGRDLDQSNGGRLQLGTSRRHRRALWRDHQQTREVHALLHAEQRPSSVRQVHAHRRALSDHRQSGDQAQGDFIPICSCSTLIPDNLELTTLIPVVTPALRGRSAHPVL